MTRSWPSCNVPFTCENSVNSKETFCPSRFGMGASASRNLQKSGSSIMREPFSLCNPASHGTTLQAGNGHPQHRLPLMTLPRSSASQLRPPWASQLPPLSSMAQSKPQPNCED
eukprot:174467-Amphidinium_carterae.1